MYMELRFRTVLNFSDFFVEQQLIPKYPILYTPRCDCLLLHFFEQRTARAAHAKISNLRMPTNSQCFEQSDVEFRVIRPTKKNEKEGRKEERKQAIQVRNKYR